MVQLWRIVQFRSQGQLKERGEGASCLSAEGNRMKSDTLRVKCITRATLNVVRKESAVRGGLFGRKMLAERP